MTDLSPPDAEKMALAERIRAHIGTIAPKCSMPVGEWNDIAEDFYEAADQLYAHPVASQGAREVRAKAADAIRTFCKSLGTNAVAVSSDGVERIYYAGISLDALSAAVAIALTSPSPDRAAAQPEYGCCMGMASASQCDCERPAALPMREAIARVINPSAFKGWQNLYDHNLKAEGPDFAKRCADCFYKKDCDEALAKADAILSLAPASANEVKPADPDAMLALTDELTLTAGRLINGDVDDGTVRVGMLCEASDAILALRAQRRTPAVTETEVILDAINDRSPRARQTIDLLLYKFDVYPRPAFTEKRPPSNQEGGK